MNFSHITKNIFGFAEMYFVNKLHKYRKSRWESYGAQSLQTHKKLRAAQDSDELRALVNAEMSLQIA
jgi:hypothetical protein